MWRTFQPEQYTSQGQTGAVMAAPEGRVKRMRMKSPQLPLATRLHSQPAYTPRGPAFKKIYRIHLHKESNLQTTKSSEEIPKKLQLATVQLKPLVIREKQIKTMVQQTPMHLEDRLHSKWIQSHQSHQHRL